MASPGDILALTELGFKALEYLEGIHRAPKERNDLVKEIETLQSLLKQLNVIDALKKNSSAPERDEFQPLAQDFDSMLPKVRKKLSERNSRPREILARIRWPQEKAGVQEGKTQDSEGPGWLHQYAAGKRGNGADGSREEEGRRREEKGLVPACYLGITARYTFILTPIVVAAKNGLRELERGCCNHNNSKNGSHQDVACFGATELVNAWSSGDTKFINVLTDSLVRILEQPCECGLEISSLDWKGI